MKGWAQARINWLSANEGGRRTLPAGTRYTTIVSFAPHNLNPVSAEWSLVIEANEPLNRAQSVVVKVWFLADEGPLELLQPGRRFSLFEGPKLVAHGEILALPETTSGNDVTLLTTLNRA